MLIDWGTIGDCISAQKCTARRIQIEKEQEVKELMMVAESRMKTLGQV